METYEIIEGIKSREKSRRNQALRHLYKNCFPKVKRFVLNNSGNIEEAEDVFQDTIATVYLNLVENRFREDSSLYTYVHSIGRNTWLMKLRKKKVKTSLISDASFPIENPEEQINIGVIEQVLHQLNDSCRALVIGFYFQAMSMQEIASTFGLGSAQAAKTKKLRCMKRLSEIVRDQGLQKDHFMI